MSNQAKRARARQEAEKVSAVSTIVAAAHYLVNPGIIRDVMFDGITELVMGLGFVLMAKTEPAPLGGIKVTVSLMPRTAATDHPEQSCDNCGHASDCATHNEPAGPNGPCDCGKLPRLGGPK